MIWPHGVPYSPTNEARPTATVRSSGLELSVMASTRSFQASTKANMAVTVKPGSDSGSTMRHST